MPGGFDGCFGIDDGVVIEPVVAVAAVQMIESAAAGDQVVAITADDVVGIGGAGDGIGGGIRRAVELFSFTVITREGNGLINCGRCERSGIPQVDA